MKKIILTGGGTAGHVTPNLALLPALREEDFEIHYIGSYNGIERRLIEAASIPYDGISSGKLRRYFDLKNFSDPLRVLKGYFEARKLMKKYKPDIVFSKARCLPFGWQLLHRLPSDTRPHHSHPLEWQGLLDLLSLQFRP